MERLFAGWRMKFVENAKKTPAISPEPSADTIVRMKTRFCFNRCRR